MKRVDAVVKTLLQVEREHVLAVLEALGWNFSHAAPALGIDRRTLHRMVVRHGISRPPKADPPAP